MMADGAANDRAIAYVRVSTVRQVEEGTSIASQSERVREYARFRRLRLMSRDVVIDDGVSGGIPLFDRTGGSRLADLIETGKYSHVIAVKLDRMFRMTTDAIDTMDYLAELGIAIHFVDFNGQALDTSTSTGRFFITMIAALAEMERGLISERTREGMGYLKDNRLRFTKDIYGWDVKEDGSIRPNWTEQSRIDFMAWQMRKNGMSAYSVANCMNARGWLGKKGGKWNSTSVNRVVRNGFHMTRSEYGMPKRWGTKPWHRRNGMRNQREERIVVKPVTEVWDKTDF
tara:strand:- start:730 stop:1587 length:858 start_codon:yes stop_codon:yes gene_type:complete